VATVAGLQARAGGGEGSAPILEGYDPVLVRRRTGRRMVPDYAPRFIAGSFRRISLSAGFIRREPVPCLYRRVNSGAQDSRRDGPPSQPAGMGSDALVREGNGGEIARSVPAEARVQTGHSGTWIARSVPAEVRARAQSAYDGGGIAMSVPTEIRAQIGHSGKGVVRSVRAEARVQTGHSGTWTARSVPAEIRARAQSAYKEAYTRAYRAYLGASPAAGDPTATPRASPGDGTCDCPSCRFLVSALCLLPEANEGCATPCFDDPTKFCLYCAGGDGGPQKIGGPFSDAPEWLDALKKEMEDCKLQCGQNPSEEAGECGFLKQEVTRITHPKCCFRLSYPFWCNGNNTRVEYGCRVVCYQTCGPNQEC
jgi:hypothetical protein